MLYVVRDKDGDLWLFTSKPVRVKEQFQNNKEFEYWEKPEYPDDGDDAYDVINIDSKLFPELKWEDEPIAVDLVPHKQAKKDKKTSDEEIEKERNAKLFVYGGEVISWNEIPLHIRKHDYPYFFDGEGNDCYPIKQKH